MIEIAIHKLGYSYSLVLLQISECWELLNLYTFPLQSNIKNSQNHDSYNTMSLNCNNDNLEIKNKRLSIKFFLMISLDVVNDPSGWEGVIFSVSKNLQQYVERSPIPLIYFSLKF